MRAARWEEIWSAIDRRARFGIRPGLERMNQLLERLGHPEQSYHIVQVAGTNGKGTTAYALARLLDAGHPQGAGLFVSPHLLHPGERIRIGGRPLDEAAAQAAWRLLEPHIADVEPSYFETLTALALTAFAQAGLSHAVLECGLGGRYDATSAAVPRLSILTSVGADHLGILGPTLADVARDKAHIAPPGGDLLCAEQDADLLAIIRRTVEERGSRLARVDSLLLAEERHETGRPSLRHLRSGERLVLPVGTRGWLAASSLALDASWRLSGGEAPSIAPVPVLLEHGDWPGRFQVLSTAPPRVLDVAHNPPALGRLAEDLRARWPGTRFNAVLAGMADKDLAGNLRALRPVLAGCRVLLLQGHARAAGLPEWESAARAAQVPITWFTRGELESLKADVVSDGAGGDPWTRQALLVTGSFLAVAAWLGDGELPPGL